MPKSNVQTAIKELKPYYVLPLHLTPAIVAAYTEESALNIFSSLCGEQLEEGDIDELPLEAIGATVKNADGTRSASLRDHTSAHAAEGVIGEFPIDYSATNFPYSHSDHGYMLALNLIMMGVPFTHARKSALELRSSNGFNKLSRWIYEKFAVSVFDVGELKLLHGNASTLQELNRLQAEKKEAIEAAISAVNRDFGGRVEKLRLTIGFKI